VKKLYWGLVLVLVLGLAVVAGPACGGGGGGAEFELSGLIITPDEVGVDEDVSIKVTVENVGEKEGSTEVTLKVEGKKVDSEDVTVAAGATKTVTFTHSEAEAGTYDIEVDGLSGTLTVTAGPPPPPGAPKVGSKWEYLIDYTGGPGAAENNHPYTRTLTAVNAMPKSDFICVPAAPQISCNLYETNTHPDGNCPGVTKPKRPLAGYTIIPMSVKQWENVANGTQVALYAPICMTAPMPLGLINGESIYTNYTAVSGTVGTPYALGAKWTYTVTTNAEILGDCISPEATSVTWTAEVVAVNESVTVPAGTFTDCVKTVETQTQPAVAGKAKTTWWSPTVQGIVKQVDDASYPPGVQTMELSSYTIK